MKIKAPFFLTMMMLMAFIQNGNGQMNEMKLQPGLTSQVIPDRADRNNNFYDNEDTYTLPLNQVFISGEIENPGQLDFSKLTKRSVIVKEALLKNDTGNQFVGAYRYDGYSLFDILCDRVLKKKNAAEFRPIIDLFVEIENAKGEKVVLSWGEIFYPNNLHNIIITTDVMRIVPSKTKDLWPLPVECKLIMSQDLVSERNISGPVKITVFSYPGSYLVNREMNPLVSEKVDLFSGKDKIDSFTETPALLQKETLHTIFYGKGRGIHSTQPFSGVYLKDYLAGKFQFNRKNLQTGLVICAGIDGYRSVFSFSEIMNRSDQAEILLVPCPNEKDGGRFRIFPSCDFFSDRAVKALSEIRVINQ